jgi:hypothetical protein
MLVFIDENKLQDLTKDNSIGFNSVSADRIRKIVKYYPISIVARDPNFIRSKLITENLLGKHVLIPDSEIKKNACVCVREINNKTAFVAINFYPKANNSF